jgi:hypothetical protein
MNFKTGSSIKTRTQFFWDVTPCHQVRGARHFEGRYCPHLHGSSSPRRRTTHYVSPQRRASRTQRHGGTSQKIKILSGTTGRTLNLTFFWDVITPLLGDLQITIVSNNCSAIKATKNIPGSQVAQATKFCKAMSDICCVLGAELETFHRSGA